MPPRREHILKTASTTDPTRTDKQTRAPRGTYKRKVFVPPPGWQPRDGYKVQAVHTAKCEWCNKHCTDDNPLRQCTACHAQFCWLCENERNGELEHGCFDLRQLTPWWRNDERRGKEGEKEAQGIDKQHGQDENRRAEGMGIATSQTAAIKRIDDRDLWRGTTSSALDPLSLDSSSSMERASRTGLYSTSSNMQSTTSSNHSAPNSLTISDFGRVKSLSPRKEINDQTSISYEPKTGCAAVVHFRQSTKSLPASKSQVQKLKLGAPQTIQLALPSRKSKSTVAERPTPYRKQCNQEIEHQPEKPLNITPPLLTLRERAGVVTNNVDKRAITFGAGLSAVEARNFLERAVTRAASRRHQKRIKGFTGDQDSPSVNIGAAENSVLRDQDIFNATQDEAARSPHAVIENQLPLRPRGNRLSSQSTGSSLSCASQRATRTQSRKPATRGRAAGSHHSASQRSYQLSYIAHVGTVYAISAERSTVPDSESTRGQTIPQFQHEALSDLQRATWH